MEIKIISVKELYRVESNKKVPFLKKIANLWYGIPTQPKYFFTIEIETNCPIFPGSYCITDRDFRMLVVSGKEFKYALTSIVPEEVFPVFDTLYCIASSAHF